MRCLNFMMALRRGMKRKAIEKLTCDNLISKVNELLEDRRYSNHLVDILTLAVSGEEDEIVSANCALEKIFLSLLERGDLLAKELSDPSNTSLDNDSEQVYTLWLQEHYSDTKKHLLENLHHSNVDIKNDALNILMKLLQAETSFPLHPVSNGICFPSDFFTEIIENIIFGQNDDYLVTQFQEYLLYADITFNVLKSLVLILKKKKEKKKKDNMFLMNTFSFLSKLTLPIKTMKESNDAEEISYFTKRNDNEGLSSLNYRYMRKLFSTAWTKFLTFKLPTNLYKKVLITLDSDNILPHLSNPLLLSDFLTRSYKIGGAVSLLALNGIYILMQNYNLEYPDFFKKLYALFEPSVLQSEHKEKFFFLADLFLSSTHIPEYLVAAFIKRLSRLSLSAPPAALLTIIPFICNLLIRHPQLKVLIDRSDDVEVLKDPFIMTETDPSKSKALESSLWEIQTLQSHWHPDVVIKARFITKPLPKLEADLVESYKLNSHELFQKELKRKYREVPLNYDKPASLFHRKEDLMKDMWLVE